MNNNPFAQFEAADTAELQQQLQDKVQSDGFTGLRLLLEGFKERLKRYSEPEQAHMEALIARAKRLFPKPGDFSPSWVSIWDDFEKMIAFKRFVFESVTPDGRDGEWQVIIDNPYTHQDIVCYPGLDFLDGAFLYAYFRTDLKQNEYIRLQKIQNVIMAFGSERAEQKEKKR